MTTHNIDPELAKLLPFNTDPEFDLLGEESVEGCFSGNSESEGLKNAPIFTGDVLEVVKPGIFPQRALYGRIISQESPGFQAIVRSPKVYINTNAPFSGIVCGVQGSGKSHSTSVLMESCLIRDERLGTLTDPLSALVFHFDTAAGGGHSQPCEAAYIASLDMTRGGKATPPKVTVLVLPNTLDTMQEVYKEIPGVAVVPLHFAQEDITGVRLLTMMKVDQEQQMPLYMENVMSILRSKDKFDYAKFRCKLAEQKFSPQQKAMLNLRLNLLDECLESGTSSDRISEHFSKGQLTIIDLSSPFMDDSSACGFFDIILGLFVEAKTEATGKLIVLDEAHKYLTDSGSSSRLTDSLLSIIRQQRHIGIRVLISTQEPTVVPAKFLELCSFVIAHRFSSPSWLEHLKRHVSSVDSQCFSKIVSLKTGQAMIFAPAGIGLRQISQAQPPSSDVPSAPSVQPFGHGYLFVRSRERITKDGGRSVLAASDGTSLRTGSTSADSAPGGFSPFGARVPKASANPPNSWENSYSPDIQHRGSHTSQLSEIDTLESEKPVFSPPSSSKISPKSVFIERCRAESPPISEIPRSPETLVKSPSSIMKPLEPVEARFRPLVELLRRNQKEGRERMIWSTVGTELKNLSPPAYTGKLGQYLDEAVDAQLINIGGPEPQQWVQLVTHKPIPKSAEYRPLVDVLQKLLGQGVTQPMCSVAADNMYKAYAYTKGSFRRYAQAAETDGVVSCDNAHNRISLRQPSA